MDSINIQSQLPSRETKSSFLYANQIMYHMLRFEYRQAKLFSKTLNEN